LRPTTFSMLRFSKKGQGVVSQSRFRVECLDARSRFGSKCVKNEELAKLDWAKRFRSRVLCSGDQAKKKT